MNNAIDRNDIPNDSTGAANNLIGRKGQLIDLAARISSGEIKTFSQVNGYIWSVVEALDEMMEE